MLENRCRFPRQPSLAITLLDKGNNFLEYTEKKIFESIVIFYGEKKRHIESWLQTFFVDPNFLTKKRKLCNNKDVKNREREMETFIKILKFKSNDNKNS